MPAGRYFYPENKKREVETRRGEKESEEML